MEAGSNDRKFQHEYPQVTPVGERTFGVVREGVALMFGERAYWALSWGCGRAETDIVDIADWL